MLTEKIETVYAAARRGSLLSDGYPTPELATRQAAHLNEGMEAAGLKPDIEVVAVEVVTTLGKPQTYVPTDPEAEEAEPPAPSNPPATPTNEPQKTTDTATHG